MLKNLITNDSIHLHRVIPQLTKKQIILSTEKVREGLNKHCTEYDFTREVFAEYVLGKENACYFQYLVRYFKQLDPLYKIRRKFVEEQKKQTENFLAYKCYKEGESVATLCKVYGKSRQWFHKYFKQMELGSCTN